MKVAVIGCGVIGRGWLQVFARAGCRVSVFDPDADQVRRAIDNAAYQDRLLHASSIEEAVASAHFVQESTKEDLEFKREIFAAMDCAAPQDAILASSTSALDVQDFAGALPGAARCITAHPFNPPSILPVVEVLPTRKASTETVERAMDMLRTVGQLPILMTRFVQGYIGNRLQAAIMREAISLVGEGVTDVEAIDTIMTDALGPRWATLGVFGTNHTNADGGLSEYYARFWPSYCELMRDLAKEPPSLSAEDIDEMARQTAARFGKKTISELCVWRDEIVSQVRALRTA
jgi:3-hydroxyacyl-CoA dehydrogenase